jgi:23S rRNA (guanosine2251-2'-O)-methyltransferase
MPRIIVGIQPVREAIRSLGPRIERLLVLHRPAAPSPTLSALARFAQAQGVAVHPADESTLRRLAREANHQGVIAIAPELELIDLETLIATRPTLLTVADRITDPHNFGAIIRSSVAFGADAVLWPEHANAPLTPATFRASAGAIEHARLCRVPSLGRALSQLRAAGLFTIALAEDPSAIALPSIDLTRPVAIVIGSEGEGIKRSLRNCCDAAGRIPTLARLPTLNASVSAGIALFEVRRQRDLCSDPRAE